MIATTQIQKLRTSSSYLSARTEFLKNLKDAARRIHEQGIQEPKAELKTSYDQWIQTFQKDRGRELYFPFLASGAGGGPFVELADGSIKLDLITGIGINFFGHMHPAFLETMLDGVMADVMQGNLQPGIEEAELLNALLKRVKDHSPLQHGWLTSCGTMANEIAIKIIRQKKSPAYKVIAFRHCFSGRSTVMQEITDNPKYREGQPTFDQVSHIPFYDHAQSLEKNVAVVLGELEKHLKAEPGKYAALSLELIQGEGGFNVAPRDFYVQIFEAAKKAGLAIWLDEIQTFGRTGELFAFQKFDLGKYVDVVTVAKMLQAAVVLFSSEYNPKPGLVSGTFSGSTMQLRTALKTLELLEEGGFLGPEGKIERYSQYLSQKLSQIKGVKEVRAIGGMIAFVPHDGTAETVKKTLHKLFDLGVVAFNCGHGPYLVRMLPPLGAMKEKDLDLISERVEKALQ